MSKIKDDVKEMQKETKSIRDKVNNQSLASEILHDYKRDKQILTALLLVSILVNIVIVVIK